MDRDRHDEMAQMQIIAVNDIFIFFPYCYFSAAY
jgi:hypothetical protein